jgi:hypothetical protein
MWTAYQFSGRIPADKPVLKLETDRPDMFVEEKGDMPITHATGLSWKKIY